MTERPAAAHLPSGKALEPVGAYAVRLLGKWNRVAQGHVAFAMSCGCAPGFPGVSTLEFEQMIMDYLLTKHRPGVESTPELQPFMAQVDDQGVLSRLLTVLARQPIADPIARPLLDDLRTSIDSFEELHGGSGALLP